MKRRDFLTKGTLAAGLARSPGLLKPLLASETSPAKSSQTPPQTAKASEEIRSHEFPRRAQGDKFLPKAPAFAESYLSPEVRISPMPLAERLRRGVVPRRGFCSKIPGTTVSEGLTSGNGHMNIEVTCDPYSEQILFHHESLLMPWKRPFEAAKVADIFPQVRQMVMDGRYQEAIEFAFREMDKGPVKVNTWPHPTVPAFMMHLDSPKTASVKDYLRTVDFETSEVKVYWTDEHGNWMRETFASRPDNVVVQLLTAAQGQQIKARIAVEKPAARMRMFGGAGGTSEVQQDYTADRLIYKCRLDPSVDNSGYAGVVRVVRNGGSARMDGDTLVVEDASSVILLTRIEWFAEYSEGKVEALRQAVEQLSPDYDAILERHRKVQSEAFNRVTVDFGGASQYGLSTEELLANQRSRPDYSPALLEKIFQMGRYWFIYTSGKYPTMVAEVNANINLQIAPGPQGDLREGMDAYFNWMESLAPDFRVNAKNIFGMRGTHYSLWPDKGVGVAFHYSTAASTGEIWPHPYWLTAGGWCCRPFWDHYLTTGDVDFLRNRVVPALKELALFYEDFLTVTGKDGNYIFVPSFSPENNPANTSPSAMLVINATMDITVCREVLTNLIAACELLGTDADSVAKWKAMLAKMPPYLMEPDGTLKEWAWPPLKERYSHRHISHLYGAWPGDEIDPDRTPQLALAAMLADRKRVPERLAAHGRCHRALVGARLKDCYMVDTELRQLIEQGYVAATLRCSHDPWAFPMPDAQGGIPTIMMEMLLYSRPGIIEVLPALPPTLVVRSRECWPVPSLGSTN
ncbi:MAG TPA: glycoside hydrolase N-terminal domain-containing protein [Terriglobia bacterium]|nr:glycoside hydrolase N-terminal domain-containing protein [Terriglobia bacterium]